jgi:pyruvate dehydrogenase (quinone)/pyruvate oxidase
MVFLGNPEYAVDLQPIDFVKIAEGFGITGIHIEDPKRCEDQVIEALNHPGPVLIEAQVDPFEPPMPPMIKREQAMHFAEALLRGEPNREKIALTALRDKVRELV